MKINHRTLAPLHCASTDETRFNLNALHFTAEGETIGTNGHLLARFRPASAYQDSGCPELEPFTVDRFSIEPLAKEQRRKWQEPCTLDVEETNANGHARFTDTASGSQETPKLDCEYPNWKQVLAKSDSEDREIGISLAVLEPLIAAARQFSETRKGGGQCVRFCIPKDNLKPFTATVLHEDSGDILEFTLMPMRLK